jgi:arylsulfatase A-like enzyme
MPFTCSLAAKGTLFERAYSSRSETWPSLTSMLTSRYPVSTGVRYNGKLLGEGVPTLSSILSDEGYLTASFLSNFCDAGGYGFKDKYCSPYSDYATNDLALTIETLHWLDGRKDGRFFLWMHYFAPHSPYYPVEGYDIFTDKGYSGQYTGSRDQLGKMSLGLMNMSKEDVDHVIGLYDGRLYFADSQIQLVYDELDKLGILDNTIVVITSDHGEELYQRNNYFFHDCSIYDSALHIPLIIIMPKGKGNIVKAPVENVDLAPTLLDLLNVSKPKTFEGRTLLPLLANGPAEGFDTALSERYGKANTSGLLSIRTREWRYIYNPMNITPHCSPDGEFYHVATEELYDENADPLELKNVASSHPDVVSQLRDELLGRYPKAKGEIARVADNATLERLRSLGYLT